MKKILILIAFCLAVPTVKAADDPVVLTPTKLYDLIETQQKRSQFIQDRLLDLTHKNEDQLDINKKLALEVDRLKIRVGFLEKENQTLQGFLNDIDTKNGFIGAITDKFDTRVKELERITNGVQRQITILHAKKADKVK